MVEPLNKLERDIYSCDAGSNAYVTALVSKMFAVQKKDLPEHKKKPLTAQEMRDRARDAREAKVQEGDAAVNPTTINDMQRSAATQNQLTEAEGEESCLLGFARVYSGTVRVGTTLYCVLPKYSGTSDTFHTKDSKYVVTATVEALYIMMGRDLVPVETVKAGNVFAVRGLEGKVWRSTTLCAPGEGGVFEGANLVRDKECLVNLGGLASKVSSLIETIHRNHFHAFIGVTYCSCCLGARGTRYALCLSHD